MVSKKASRGPVSKVSSAAAPTQSDATTLSSHKSSLLRSAFSPSEYQLALFASVIQSLDAPHLRIHDVNSGRLQSDHAVKPRESITSLDWGYYGHAHRDRDHLHPKKKKRKRSSGVNGVAEDADDDVDKGGDVVVAFGTSSSEIRMYSPAEDKVVGTLAGAHERGIRDFKFTSHKPGVEGWSIGGDGRLVQWDLHKGRSIRVVTLPSASVATLSRPVSSNPPVLCASQTPYIIDLEQAESGETSFSAMRNTIHSLISSSADLSNLSDEFLAADSDRYINVFDRQKRKLLGSLVTDTGVERLSLHRSTHQRNGRAQTSDLALLQRQVLAAVTDNGTVELFAGPFHQFRDPLITDPQGSLKSKGKSRTRRADAVVKIVRPDKTRSAVPIVSVSFHGSDLVIAWVEGAANLLFHRIRWQDEDSEGLSLRGEVEIVKTKTSSLPGSAVVNGVKDIGKTHVDETHAVVEQGGVAEGLNAGATQKDAIMVLSDEDLEGGVASQSESEEAPPAVGSTKQPPTKEINQDVEMADDDDNDGEHAEPSFGELLRANASEPIDVEAALEANKPDSGALVPTSKHDTTTALDAPSGLTLSTVLTQSLKTNDNSLLESCFHSTDMNVVRATIQRIDSSLATTLLQKLAERLSSRPGRYGHLLVWVQWTCVAHGGAIAGRPDILKQMTSLFRVMDQRSASLSSLLLLKGKLDMLDAQLSLRQGMQDREGRARGEDEGEENVIYVEGQEDEVESGDEEDEEVGERDANAEPVHAGTTSTRARRGKFGGVLEADEEDDEHMPLAVNGIASDDEDEKEEEEEDLVDDEAELSVDDGDEVSEDEEEDDDEDNGDESMEEFVADSAEESDASIDAEPVAIAPPKGATSKANKSKARQR